jgi:ADP-ribose pyrophosphatase YjhB (NUDIX family)
VVKIDESWYRKPDGKIKTRTSAGGVIARREGDRWLIALAREGDYEEFVLPKGGVETGESIEDAARREIAEEAGFTDLRFVAKLGTLERLNFRKTRWMTTHVFLFITEQTKGTPTHVERHPNPPRWFDVEALPENIFWPCQKELLLSRRAEIVNLLNESG